MSLPATIAPGDVLTESEVAEILRLKRDALRVWRRNGHGPRYLKLSTKSGPVRYLRADVAAWIAQQAHGGPTEETQE